MSPTQRTLSWLKEHSFPLYQVTEKWNPWAKIRQDLFHFVDVLAIDNASPQGLGATIGIQVTSRGNISARRKKIENEHGETLRLLKQAGWLIQIHAWGKVKVKRGGKAQKWELKIVEL